MKFENTEVWGFEHALRGMRNPMESWIKSDSGYCGEDVACAGCSKFDTCQNDCDFSIGKNDLALARKLISAGSEHRKFLRQIFVSVDITAPAYFMAELDTYKVGVVRDSTSFQHKGTRKRFEIDDFEVDDDIKEVLRIKTAAYPALFYSYDTTDFKVYTCENGREYEVYKNGRIFAKPFSYTDTMGRTRVFERREITPSQTRAGYFEMNLGGQSRERWLLHRLVATVWLDNPNNYATVDHKDGNKSNNCVENLEWVSLEENVKREWGNFDGFDLQHDYRLWKLSSKVLPPDRLRIKEMHATGQYTQKQLAVMFGLGQAQVSVIYRSGNSTSDNRELFEHCWYWEQILDTLNVLRDKYLETKDYKYFRLIRQLLPMSYLYRSTVTMSYENVLAMVRQRKNHKLAEWKTDFMDWARTLPYAEELLFI